MARPRTFEMDDAVERALAVFWQNGYEGTSLPVLLEGVGISRGSLYKAFGSKGALFERALALYDERHVQPACVMLKDDTLGGLERISRVFKGSLGRVLEGDRRGCLLCTTASGVAHNDPAIAALVHAQLDALTEGFASALADGTEVTDAHRAGARALTLNYVGLRTMSRSGAPADHLQDAVRQTLAGVSAGMAETNTAAPRGRR
ncbi:TetR/AcrR family transcriptional regulator [Rhizobiaceae bacterium]|nr:TetR/AcrR family transcriptional regulator [Rhizobiaceae bacterium]